MKINNELNKDFLNTVLESLKEFLKNGSRSNKKLKPLHGNIKNDLLKKLHSEGIKGVELISLDNENNKEDIVKGRYYEKKVDISIRKNLIGAIGVKFVMNNYMQNANNYFENMLGETANIRATNIPYFQVLILFDKMPYFKKGGNLGKWEVISKETHLKKYIKLSQDNINEFYHTPILTFLAILSLPKEITEDKTITNKNIFKEKLLKMLSENNLKINYSTKFSPEIFKENVVLNNYEVFLQRLIYYFLYKTIQ